jgi:Tfp pilus assembly protein PilZ
MGTSRDLSSGGLFVELEEPLPVGTRVAFGLRLEPTEDPVRGVAAVAWFREEQDGPGRPAGIGLDVVEWWGSDRERVAEVVVPRAQNSREPTPRAEDEAEDEAAITDSGDVFDGTGVFLSPSDSTRDHVTDVFLADRRIDEPQTEERVPVAVPWPALIILAVLACVLSAMWWWSSRARDVAPTRPPTVVAEEPVAAEPEPGTETPPSLAGSVTVERIQWHVDGDLTVIELVTDAPVDAADITPLRLEDPPRLLVRIRGVASGFQSELLETDVDRITSIRTGYHAAMSPPELHVVFDLAGAGVRLVGIQVDPDAVRVRLGGA